MRPRNNVLNGSVVTFGSLDGSPVEKLFSKCMGLDIFTYVHNRSKIQTHKYTHTDSLTNTHRHTRIQSIVFAVEHP